MNNELYTIGYATKSINDFLNILKKHGINCIVDVRTSPYSKQFKEFNKENMERILKNSNIKYLHFGSEFGARRSENEVYTLEKDVFNRDCKTIEFVDFQKVYNLPIFLRGVERIKDGLNKGYKIAFLCSEKMPFNCHRALMVSEYFFNNGFRISHLIDEKQSINHADLDTALKENFFGMFEKFKKNNKDDIEKSEQCCDIFGNSHVLDKSIKKWLEFFNSYSRNKSLYLRNIQIGYKKGESEDDD